MARQVYRAKISIEKRGGLSAPQLRAAQTAAMAEFAPLLQQAVRTEARRRVKNSPSLNNRGRRRYPRTMADSYTANLIAGGRSISLTANTLRGRIFELGARAHPIFPRGTGLLYYRNPKPMGRLVKRTHIPQHPGQRANPVMGDTLRAMAPVGERILDRHVERALIG